MNTKLLLIKILLTLLLVAVFSASLFYPELGSGFLAEFELLGVYPAMAVLSIFLLLVFFYCRDLHITLSRVAPQHRAAAPQSVWWMFAIPYNFIEDFFIVYHVGVSLKREAKINAALANLRYFGFYSGIGWCAAQILSLAPGDLGRAASLVAIALWIVHWRFIRRVNRCLQEK